MIRQQTDPLGAIFTQDFKRQLRLSRKAKPIVADTFDYENWLREVFPHLFTLPFAPHHHKFWKWGMRVGRDTSPEPAVCIFPRGGGKTTNLDTFAVWLLAHGMRDFIAILGKKFDVAEDRVASIRALLEDPEFRKRFPVVGEPLTHGRGSLYSWKRRLLVTASRQVVAGLSLEQLQRGINVLGKRPDIFILDDIDDMFDTPYITKKKERKITQELLPMASNDRPPALVFVQNRIKADGVAHRLEKGIADWAQERTVIGAVPAIRGLKVEARREKVVDEDGVERERLRQVIVGGEPSWIGQDIKACQTLIDRGGLAAFLHEQQHEVMELEGALLKVEHFHSIPRPKHEDIAESVVAIDPSGGRVECGIFGMSALKDGRICAMRDVSQMMGDLGEWAKIAVLLAYNMGADVAIEPAYGGKNVTDTVLTAALELQRVGLVKGLPRVYPMPTEYSKRARAWNPAQLHKQGVVVYANDEDFSKVKTEWTTWVQGESKDSPNRMDAEVHAINFLCMSGRQRPKPCNVDF